MENINENKDAIYYCEQDDPFCQYPNCVCNTVKPKQDRKQILSEMMQEDEIIEQFAIKYSNMHQDVSSTLGKYLVKAVFKDGAIWQQKKCTLNNKY